MDAFIPDTLGEGALVAGTAGFGLFARTVAKGVGGILRNADECFDAAKVSENRGTDTILESK